VEHGELPHESSITDETDGSVHVGKFQHEETEGDVNNPFGEQRKLGDLEYRQ
jgi:hypothetical protein